MTGDYDTAIVARCTSCGGVTAISFEEPLGVEDIERWLRRGDRLEQASAAAAQESDLCRCGKGEPR